MTNLADRIGIARAVLIAGPTASGKSEMALRLADALASRGQGAWIVNADSMQVYDALRLLTARPRPAEERRAPHRLYGHVPAEIRYSVGAWLRDARDVLRDAEAEGTLPIFTGGTGLYFKALTEGLAAGPLVSAAIRKARVADLSSRGAAALHAELAEIDPVAAGLIRPSDPVRIVRALESIDAGGMPVSQWRAAVPAEPPLLPRNETAALVLEPDRTAMYRRIEERFDTMVEQGALDEVSRLLERGLGPDLPVMKAIGVRAFAACSRGEIPLADAVRKAKTETRRYAKRQMTWFRNQMTDWERLAV